MLGNDIREMLEQLKSDRCIVVYMRHDTHDVGGGGGMDVLMIFGRGCEYVKIMRDHEATRNALIHSFGIVVQRHHRCNTHATI